MDNPIVVFDIPSIEPKNADRWTPAEWQVLFDCARKTGLWHDFSFESALGSGRFRPVTSLAQVASAAPTWKSGNHTFSHTKDDHQLGQYLNIGVPPNDYRVKFSSPHSLLIDEHKTFLNSAVDALVCLHSGLAPTNWFRPGMGVRIEGLGYSRPRPPRRDTHIRASAVLDAVSTTYYEEHDSRRRDAFRTMEAESLPSGAERFTRDGLVIIRWINDLSNPVEVARQMSQREQWINRVLEPPIEGGYNDQGDQEILPIGLEPHPPLTFYEPALHRGFKAIYVDSAGNADDLELGEYIGYLRAGKLADGTLLDELYLIAPDRNRALALYGRAGVLGVSAVYYPASNGTWFNPRPPGLWLN
jgi:hypothetical protein